jgi:hypothetical protein
MILTTLLIGFSGLCANAQTHLTLPKGLEKKGGSHPAVLRSQLISADFSQLTIDSTFKNKNLRVKITPFQDLTVEAEIKLDKISDSDRGTFVGQDLLTQSDVIISRKAEAVVIDLFHEDKHIQIHPTLTGEYIAEEYELAAFPSLIDDIVAPTAEDLGGTTEPSSSQATPADGLTTVDILIAFATDSGAALGGQNGAIAFADNAVTIFNQAATNSMVTTQLRVVGVIITTAYQSSGDLSVDLKRLASASDGYLDDLASAREFYKADLVAVITESNNYCGIGYMPGYFTATNRGCAIGNKSLAHEIGHNFGCGHDASNGNGATAYAHGYRFYGSDGVQYRSVMAYAPGSRISYFSNPNVNYLGAATGDALTADNARRINEYSTSVASVRSANVSPTASSISFSSSNLNFGSLNTNESKLLQLTITNNGSTPLLIENLTITGDPFQSADKANCLLTLPAFGSCKFNISFMSANPGTFNGSLTVQAPLATNNLAMVTLTGTAIQPTPNLSFPNNLTFPRTSVNSASNATLTLSNTGTANLTLSTISVSDATNSFSLSANPCSGTTLMPSQNCNVTLEFAPIASGTYSGKVLILSNDPDLPTATVNLSGSTGKGRGRK